MSKKQLAIVVASFTTLVSSIASAQEPGGGSETGSTVQAMAALAMGLAIGLAALGGGMGQGRASAAALEGISRNPGAAGRIQTPMILGLALIESLVLFAFAVAIMLYLKIK